MADSNKGDKIMKLSQMDTILSVEISKASMPESLLKAAAIIKGRPPDSNGAILKESSFDSD